MKKHLFFLMACLVIARVSYAQTDNPFPRPKPDLIFRKDNAILEVQVEKVLTNRIRYHLVANPNGAIREILLTDVVKIRFADGTEKQFTSSIPSIQVTEPVVHTHTETPTSLAIKKPKVPFLALTIGSEGTYMVGSSAWVADSVKTGFRYGVGGSVALDVHLNAWLAVSLRSGLTRYAVERRFYTTEGALGLQATTTFQQIPIHIGLKLYPVKQVYMMPEAGIQLLTYSYQDGTFLSGTATSQRLAYGGSIGTEFGGRTLWFDISARYNIIQVKSLGESFSAIGPVQYVGFRLAVGFIIKK